MHYRKWSVTVFWSTKGHLLNQHLILKTSIQNTTLTSFFSRYECISGQSYDSFPLPDLSKFYPWIDFTTTSKALSRSLLSWFCSQQQKNASPVQYEDDVAVLARLNSCSFLLECPHCDSPQIYVMFLWVLSNRLPSAISTARACSPHMMHYSSFPCRFWYHHQHFLQDCHPVTAQHSSRFALWMRRQRATGPKRQEGDCNMRGFPFLMWELYVFTTVCVRHSALLVQSAES